jgi:hypothetical protein
VSENSVLRRILVHKEKEVAGGWRGLYNENLRNLDASPNTSIIRVIKSRRMRWTGLVASKGKMTNYIIFLRIRTSGVLL